MEKSGFFDAHVVGNEYDRVYLAESFAAYFASFIGNGVFALKSSELQVRASADGGMNVVIKPGQGYINGYWYENTDDVVLRLSHADGILNRIDNIVLRWGLQERTMWLAVTQGEFNVNAIAPAIKRNKDYFELCLAQVSVRAGAINIYDSDITDKRQDSNYCGVVSGVVKQIDASSYGYQLNTFIDRYIAKAEDDYEDKYIASLEDLKSRATNAYNDFIQWLTALKNNTNNQAAIFLTWLSDYRNTIISEITSLEAQLRNLITSEVASALAARIAELENKNPVNQVASINHGMNDYLSCDLYEYTFGWGLGGAGVGPAGGGSLVSVPNFSYEMGTTGNVKIKVGSGYGTVEAVNKIEDGLYAIVFRSKEKCLIVKLKQNKILLKEEI